MLAAIGMDMALGEITLVLFTTLAPSGAFAVMIVMARLLALGSGASGGARVRLERSLVLPLVVTMVGLVASATHLGNPANALYVFARVGKSPLSNEVACAVAFLALVGVYWLYSFSERPRARLKRVWLVVAIVAGAAFITAVAFAYRAETIMSWDTPFVPIALWLNALVGGPLLALLTLRIGEPGARVGCIGRALVVVSAAAFVANVVVNGLQFSVLASESNAVGSPLDFAPWYAVAFAAFVVLAAAGIAVDALALFGGRRAQARSADAGAPAVAACADPDPDADADAPAQAGQAMVRRSLSASRAVLACALAFAGIFAMRFAFYATHLTV